MWNFFTVTPVALPLVIPDPQPKKGSLSIASSSAIIHSCIQTALQIIYGTELPEKPHDVPLSLSDINQITYQPGFEQEFAQQSSDTPQPFLANRVPTLRPDAVASVRTKFPSQCASLVKLFAHSITLHVVGISMQVA